jgi:hypothetical protein
MQSLGGDGGVGDAKAQGMGGGACCTPAVPTFTKLAEGSLPSDPISVAGYREVVVYLAGNASGCANPQPAMFSVDASSPAGGTGQPIVNGARLRVDGAFLVLPSPCAVAVPTGYVVAGVQ